MLRLDDIEEIVWASLFPRNDAISLSMRNVFAIFDLYPGVSGSSSYCAIYGTKKVTFFNLFRKKEK